MSQLKVIRARQERRKRRFSVWTVCLVLMLIYMAYRAFTADPPLSKGTILRRLALLCGLLALGFIKSLPGFYLTRRGEEAALEEAARKKQAWRERQKAGKNGKKRKNK